MKRPLYLCILAICLALFMAACAPQSPGSPPDAPQAATPADDPPRASGPEAPAAAVPAKVQLYEGVYFDERVYGYMGGPESESPLVYCELLISNVTDSSFDFSIDEKIMATGETRQVLPKGTAVFTGDGMQAVYHSDETQLTFTFPDHHKAHPAAADVEITGMDILEGNNYVNNQIPGHEFG